MIITLKNANFNNPNLPLYVSKFEGFVADQLQNLYLFDVDDLVTAISDKKGGGSTKVVVGASATAAMIPGGGINFNKNSVISAQPVNMTEPFTMMAAMRLGLIPETILQAMFGVPEYFQYGFALYGSGSTASVEANEIKMVLRQAYKGIQDSTKDTIFQSGVTYKDYRTFFLNYNGNGTMKFSVYDGPTLGVSKTKDIDEVAYTTNASNVVQTNLAPCVGNPQGFFTGGDIHLDAFAVYTKELTPNEMATNAAKAKEIMTERGRFS